MSDMPKEIKMFDVPARLDNSEAIGYLQGYNDAVKQLRADLSEKPAPDKLNEMLDKVTPENMYHDYSPTIAQGFGVAMAHKSKVDAEVREAIETVSGWVHLLKDYPDTFKKGFQLYAHDAPEIETLIRAVKSGVKYE